MKSQDKKALFFLFSANTISGFAQGITMLSIPWSIIQLADGKLLNSLMVSVVTLGSLFWGLYAGTLIDKYNRKRVFLSLTALDFTLLCSIAGIGFYMGSTPFWLMAIVFTITIFTYNVHYPNLYAFVQELFSPQYYARVNSAIEIQGQSTNFLGMMVGGLLLDGSPEWGWWPTWLQFEPWSMAEIFLMDGITYLLAFVLISQIPYQRKHSFKVDTGSIVQRLKIGFAYLNDHRYLFIFGVFAHVIFFSLLIVIQIIGPVYVMDYLTETASTLAIFKGFYAIGAISAGLLGLSLFIRKNHLIKQIIYLLITAGICYGVLSFTHSVLLTWIVAILLGICNAGARILRVTYIVRIVPNHVIGRVNSIFAVINVMMRVIFAAFLAIPFFSAEGNGENIIYSTLALGVIMLVAGLILIVFFNKFNQEAAVGE